MLTLKVVFIGKTPYDEQIIKNTQIEVADGTTLTRLLQELKREFSVDTSTNFILLNNKDVRYLPPDSKLSNDDTISIVSIIAGG
jgi:molybdopterin converting factor small subunit